ncbi:hypothetical protein Poli38472_006568 [Pythium oligandrum]|uniref:Phosphodiesterase n=1 Tax=Pythium oligandrum TaxID=41045 RepID=A0A8K1C5A3_PYTOL|nr:hypothetical protein Poli38472_006568 [Pythium oligandrum]|eukprot:TMW56558.1 hypothetical protein Poli38472_006568 [Pythium oligandrum]
MVAVPLGALQVAIEGVRVGVEKKQQLREELERAETEAKALQQKLRKRQDQLERCAAFRPEIQRPTPPRVDVGGANRGGRGDPRAAFRSKRSKSALFSSSMRDLVGELADEMNQLMAREENLRALMDATRDLSQKSDYLDVVASALRAAQSVIAAEKYTLGILNEKKDGLDLYSNPPVLLPGRPVMEEGGLVVDSNTTFGRVILTGKSLEIDEIGDSDAVDLFEDQLSMLNFEPQALLCAPIFNVHGIMVGVFQVITRKRPVSAPMAPTLEEHLDDDGQLVSSSSMPSVHSSMPFKTIFSPLEKESFRYICVITGTAIWNMALAKAHQIAQGRIECLLRLNRNISVETNSSSVLDQIIAVSYELLSAESIQLYVRDEGTDEFYIASGTGGGAKDEYHTEHNGIAGYVMRTGQLILTNSAQEHPEFDPHFDVATSFHTRQVLCAPVKDADSKVLAVVCASNKADGGEFTPEDALYLNYAADAAGISLHKSNLLREVITSQRITEARLRLTDFVGSSTPVAEFVNLVMEEGKKLMNCDRFGFLLVDQLKKELWITQIDGKNIRMPINKGISGLVAMTGERVCTRDAYTHSWFDPTLDKKTGYRTTSVLCMPVFEDHAPTNPKIVAVVMVINKKDGSRTVPFTATDHVNLERYCHEIQFALGRLSLDISYYKVVSDCEMNGVNASSPQAFSPEPKVTVTSSVIGAGSEEVTEGQIIASIVHKYCQGNDLEGLEVIASASSLPNGADAWVASEAQNEDLIMIQDSGNIVGIGDVDRWDFCSLDLSNADIFISITVIFRVFNFLDIFHIPGDKFATFLSHVASHYRPNPFHNFQHAFQVMHTTYIMIRRECSSYFSSLDIFTMLIAALCHDIDHPGNNNDFEVKSLSQMALTHNDDAVLERHHCRVTFIILGHASANILENLPRDTFLKVRRLIIHCILATDMSKHFEKCKALEGLTKRHLAEKKYVFMAILLHASDLSGQALPYDQAIRWGMRVLTEFQNQAKSEAEMNVPVDSFMTNLHQMKTRITVQMNFINYVLRPIWRPLGALCKQLRVYSDSLEANFDLYKTDLEKIDVDQEDPPAVYVRGESSRLLSRKTKEGARVSTRINEE